jgi:hypothetical protein
MYALRSDVRDGQRVSPRSGAPPLERIAGEELHMRAHRGLIQRRNSCTLRRQRQRDQRRETAGNRESNHQVSLRLPPAESAGVRRITLDFGAEVLCFAT